MDNVNIKRKGISTELIITGILYLVSIAFQYGIFSQRIANLEANINDIKTDIHEMRSHVAWK